MKRFFVAAFLAFACGCQAETADDPLQAWERLRAAAVADDPTAVVKCFSEASREKELADNKLLVTMAPKSLPPDLAARAKPDETSPWPADRLAGELFLLKMKKLWSVGAAESAAVESKEDKKAVLISLNPRNRVRWALVLEGKAWKFDATGSTIVPRKLGDANDSPTECRNRLLQMGVYVSLFESKFKTYPASWAEVKRPDLQEDERIGRCSFGGHAPFEFCYPIDNDETRADWMMGWDPEKHPDGKDVFDDAEFQKLLAAQMKDVKERVDGLLEKAKAAPDSENAKRRIAGLESLKASAEKQK
ncbi:MAG: hypothetical protein K8T20_19995 [Planctomycetes bacterium]|nr:hypothetical protein [Planctomycetota bacterium]